MKIFNHKQILNKVFGSLVTQNDGMMSIETLHEIIDICEDCRCSACSQVLPWLKGALAHYRVHDIQGASLLLDTFASSVQFLFAVAETNALKPLTGKDITG